MSVQSNSLFSEKLPVSEPDLLELADPFETNLNRTLYRVAGLLLPGGPILADAYVDHLKGEQIRFQIDQLDMAVRDPKANPDLFIQKEIYSSIQRYTDRSKTIKTVVALAGTACGLFQIDDFRRDANGFLSVNNRSFKVATVLAWITLGGFCYSVVRRYTEGLQLQADNMALASRLSYAKHKQI